MAHKPSPLGLRVIGSLKLISAALLFAVAFGIFHLLGKDIGDTLGQFVHRLHLDPENKHITEILAGVSGISPKQLKAIDAATFLYGVLYLVEGVGLLLARHWAEYLTIIATASLIPFEIYEVAHKVSAIRIAVMAVNVAMVVYLVYRLRADRREAKATVRG